MGDYRSNVCGVITDASREQVLVFRRIGYAGEAYCCQFPQGGLNPGEPPEQGLLRELLEEIGTAGVEILRQAHKPIRYDYPARVRASFARRHPEEPSHIGQEQYWFLLQLSGGTASIHFKHAPAEFDAYRWMTPLEAVQQVVPFKQMAYRQGLHELGLLDKSFLP